MLEKSQWLLSVCTAHRHTHAQYISTGTQWIMVARIAWLGTAAGAVHAMLWFTSIRSLLCHSACVSFISVHSHGTCGDTQVDARHKIDSANQPKWLDGVQNISPVSRDILALFIIIFNELNCSSDSLLALHTQWTHEKIQVKTNKKRLEEGIIWCCRRCVSWKTENQQLELVVVCTLSSAFGGCSYMRMLAHLIRCECNIFNSVLLKSHPIFCLCLALACSRECVCTLVCFSFHFWNTNNFIVKYVFFRTHTRASDIDIIRCSPRHVHVQCA